jgi:diguanylate cyclase (GGDEF)-like protein
MNLVSLLQGKHPTPIEPLSYAQGIRLPFSARDEGGDIEMDRRLHEILEKRTLSALFQPIVDMKSGEICGYEGLIRGPSNSPLHAPLQLFRAAALCHRTAAVEHLCRRVTLECFARQALTGDLFLNVSPECLLQPAARYGETQEVLDLLAIDPKHVVIELTEQQPAYDYDLLREAVQFYRSMGFRIAIDDLGEGSSSLRLWSELRPEFVKIDMHFIQGCDNDPIKKQFLQSIQEIALKSGSQIIAEGIETVCELNCVRDIGIARGQGYFLARPATLPPRELGGEAAILFARHTLAKSHSQRQMPTAARLLRQVMPIPSTAIIEEAYLRFDSEPELQSLPVVDGVTPVGIIGRYALIDRLARPFRRELFGRKPCHTFMNERPLLVEIDTTLQDLGHMVGAADSQQLADGFIIVEKAQYRGTGTGQDLMREITQLQIQAARHANSLTGLPGNEPISQMIATLLEGDSPFWAAYFDLDHFKPFNDVYGYAAGDEVICLLAQALRTHVDPNNDFVGHIGGDDFLVLFRSHDWEERCQHIIAHFSEDAHKLFTAEDIAAGGYTTENRQGKQTFTPLVSLSIGVVPVLQPEGQHIYKSHRQIATAAAAAKKQAKKIAGNSIFVERRTI